MINEEISKEVGQPPQTIISYTIKALKESINLDKEIRKNEWIFRKSKWKLKKSYGIRNKNKRPLQKKDN